MNDRLNIMKEHCLWKCYSCSGEMYKLLDTKILNKLIGRIKEGSVKLNSDIVYGKDKISLEENFLSILNKYIGYIRDNYLINHCELVPIIEKTLKNKYNYILFEKKDVHKDYIYFNKQFIRMFIYNLFTNIKFYSKDCDESSSIKRAYIKLKRWNINNYDDLKRIEKFFYFVINNRKNNLLYFFTPYWEVNKDKYSFYMMQVEWVLDDYYNSCNI